MGVVRSQLAKFGQVVGLVGIAVAAVIACSSSKDSSSNPAGPNTYDVSWEITFSNPKLAPFTGHERFTSDNSHNVEIPLPVLLRFLSNHRPEVMKEHVARYVKLLQTIKAKDANGFEEALKGIENDSLVGGVVKKPLMTLLSAQQADLLRFKKYLAQENINANIEGSGLLATIEEKKTKIRQSANSLVGTLNPELVPLGDTLEAMGEVEDWDRVVLGKVVKFESESARESLKNSETPFLLVGLQRITRGLERAWLKDENFDFEAAKRSSDRFAVPALDYQLKQGNLIGSRDLQAHLGKIAFLLSELSPEINVKVSIEKMNAKRLRGPIVITKTINVKAFLAHPPTSLGGHSVQE